MGSGRRYPEQEGLGPLRVVDVYVDERQGGKDKVVRIASLRRIPQWPIWAVYGTEGSEIEGMPHEDALSGRLGEKMRGIANAVQGAEPEKVLIYVARKREGNKEEEAAWAQGERWDEVLGRSEARLEVDEGTSSEIIEGWALNVEYPAGTGEEGAGCTERP